jgi:hypothetical protein
VQAPEHVIERARAAAKAAETGKKLQARKAPEGEVSWTEETFSRLRDAPPEPLVSRMRVDHAMILNVVNQPGDAVDAMQALLEDSHEDERGRTRLYGQAQALGDELVAAGVLAWLSEPDAEGRSLALAVDLQENFALNQPLASFALQALELLGQEFERDPLDVLSVVEAILDDPFPVLMAQANKAKGEAVAAMKADGIEYEERMELLEEVTYPKPLEEGLRQAFHLYRETHPWVREADLSPKSVVRDMYEQGRTFTEFIGHYGLSRSEGLVLRYLSDAYRALRRTVPESIKTDELDEIVDWLGETVRQTDSSLLDEWEALADPDAAQRVADGEPVPPVRPITGNERAFTRMVRNALFQRVRLAATDRSDALGDLDTANAALTDPPGRPAMSASDWHDALGAYWDEYEWIDTGPQGRSPSLLMIERADPAVWRLRQIIEDPDGNHDFAIVGSVDLDASDAAGEPVVRIESFGTA